MKADLTRKSNILALALLAVFVTVGVGRAAIPSSSNGVIHSCYQKPGLLANPGGVRVIDKEQGQSCRSNETGLQWNQQGRQGETGPQGAEGPKGDPCLASDPECVGPQGETGPIGPAGPAGSAAAEVFFADDDGRAPTVGVARTVILSMTLPAGSYVVDARLTAETSAAVNSIGCEIPETRAQQTLARDAGGYERSREFSITSAFDHAGGAIELRCDASVGNPGVDVYGATLLATKVGAVNPSIPAG